MQGYPTDVIKPEEAVTLHGLFLERVRRTPDAVAYRYFDTQQNVWRALTWIQMRDQVASWQAALRRERLAPGERVALMLRNCPQWVMFEQAAISLGLVVIPLYTVDRPENAAYIINDAQVKVLLFETAEQWQGLQAVVDQLGGVQRLVSLVRLGASGDARLQCAEDWLGASSTLEPESVRDRDALATIIYTSGTTGKPKGVMLSHHNILYNAYASLLTFHGGLDSRDVFLSFLPLSHTFERTTGYYMAMMGGSAVAYARSVHVLAEDLKTVRPTVLASVPRIYERIYKAIHEKMDAAPAFRRRLFEFTVNVGWERFEHRQGRRAWNVTFLLWPLLNHLVAAKVLDLLGGRLRLAISGGAALPVDVARMFISLGLPLVNGYGLTETSPVVCVNRVDDNRPDSVGPPLDGIEVRIGVQDALMIRGPSNMLGYWNNPAASAAVMERDGWLNSGDTARIGEDGHVYITGRLKEIIVLSTGEKVSPVDLEAAILRDRLFEQVMVYGEGRSMLVALAVVNPEQWQVFAREAGARSDGLESPVDSHLEQRALDRIALQIKEFPGSITVRRVLLLTEPWSVENGMLTPTLKLKRAQVEQRFAKEIEELYTGR